MKRGIDFWDVLMILGASVLFGWALLKALNIIHSPVWIEMIPYFTTATVVLGAVYKLGKIKMGIEETDRKVSELLKIKDDFIQIKNEHNLAMQGKLKIKH